MFPFLSSDRRFRSVRKGWWEIYACPALCHPHSTLINIQISSSFSSLVSSYNHVEGVESSRKIEQPRHLLGRFKMLISLLLPQI
jgi:hypothetical protein